MNKTEAIHTNVLIGFLCGFDRPSGGPWTLADARRAAMELSVRVHTTLHAGPSEDRVAAAFDAMAHDDTDTAGELDHVPPHLRATVLCHGGDGTHGRLLLGELVAAGLIDDPEPAATAYFNATRKG